MNLPEARLSDRLPYAKMHVPVRRNLVLHARQLNATRCMAYGANDGNKSWAQLAGEKNMYWSWFETCTYFGMSSERGHVTG